METIVIIPPRAAAAFSPSDVTGMIAWWDASSLAYANGAAVETWNADYGGLTFTKEFGTGTPVFRPTGVNGIACVENMGARWLNCSSISGVKTAIVVAKYSGATFSTYRGLLRSYTTGGELICGDSGTANLYTAELPAGSKLYIDGVETPNGAANAWHVFGWTNPTAASGLFRLGSGNYAVWYGYYSEVIMYDNVISADNLAKITTYLKEKYGIS